MSRKSRRTKSENEDLSVRRCARLIADPCRVLKKAGFCVWPSNAKSTFPTSSIDFDIPNDWKSCTRIQAVKLPQYRSLVKNFYRPPLQRGSCDPDDNPQCSCSQENGCDMHCQNRQLFMECAIGDCNSVRHRHGNSDKTNHLELNQVLPYCLNSSVQRRFYPKCEVFKTDSCGYGLKVCVNVTCGTVMMEYTGEVITSTECSDRMRGMKEHEDFYFASLGGGLMLDAKRMGSVARFANHSCEPNCDLQKWSVLGESCIVLVAKLDLKMGTEMTYNYQYYNDGMDCIAKMKRQKCLCGSQRCSGTIGGRVVASDADTWLKKASNLLSGNRKYSLDTLNEHIRSSSSCKISSSCDELQSLKGMIREADRWKTQRDALFEKAVQENVLLDSKECIDLLNCSPVGVRIEECVHLDSLVKNVLRIEKVIRSLEGVASVVVVENSCVDEVKGLLNNTEELNSLNKDKGNGVVECEGEGKGCDIIVESSCSSSSVDHLACGLRTDEELMNGHIGACTDLDPVTLQSIQILEKVHHVDNNAGDQYLSTSTSLSTSAPSLIKDVVEDVMGDVISTDLNPFRSTDFSVSNEEISSSISSLADLKCDMHESVTDMDMIVEEKEVKEVKRDNKTSYDITDTRMHSTPSPQLKSIHWHEFVTLLKDVASVLPVRCDRCEVLLEMYSSVNTWVKEHIGGLLHHSPNSRLHSTTTAASSSSSSSTASASSSSASASASSSTSSSSFSSSSSSLHNSAITMTTSAVANDKFQISKGGQSCINLNDSTLDVNKMNPLAAILSKISSVYRSKTLDLTLFIAEDFLQFRVGLYMERQDALRGEGRSNEIAESRKNMTLPTLLVSCTVATPQKLGENGKKEGDMICFCMMPSPMGETPILSQCDTCDRWYHPNCTNALLVSRTASQCAQTFECPLCSHKKGKPSTIAYKPLSEWKLSIHSGIRMKGKSGGVNEIQSLLSSTKNDSGYISCKSNAKECDMKQVQKKMKRERADPFENSLSKKSKKQLPSRESSIPVIKSECLVQVVDRQEDPLGPNITRALPDHGSPGVSAYPLSYTVPMLITSSSITEVSNVMSSHNCNQKFSLPSLPASKADVTALTTPSTYPTIPEDQSTPHVIIKAIVDPILPMGSILTESVDPKGPIKSAIKKVKVHVVKPSNDPMTVTDVKCAMLSEKKMRFQKNPVVLLLGLCSVFMDEWRGRARSFMLREDVQLVVRGGVLGEITTVSGSDSSQTLQLSQYDNNVAYHSEERLNREALLLQECLQLYFEPRLLRVKPVETLDLRALAFLISASTTMAIYTVHTPDAHCELKNPLSDSPIYGSGTRTGDVNDPNRQVKTTADTSQYLITLKELKLIVEGGNYFLKLLKNEMSEKEDKPLNLKEADIGAVSNTNSKSETATQSTKSVLSKGDERSDFENVCRERLYDRIYFIVIKVSCRLDMCIKMLRVASEYRSSQRTFFKNEGDLLFNAVSEIDSMCTNTSDNILCPIECPQNPAASCEFKHKFNEEIFKLDEAVETACQGIFIKDQYAYVRMKNILLEYCKNIPRNMNMQTEINMNMNMNMNMNIMQNMTLNGQTALGYYQTSIDKIQKYCWCRGIDDGRPMVQCDGCDEWFHSACMGLCKTSLKSNIKSKKKALQLAVNDPLHPVCSKVMLDHDDAAEELINISQNKIKKKCKIKFTTKKKSIEEIDEIVKSTFYCIACAEDRNEDYAFAWTTDSS